MGYRLFAAGALARDGSLAILSLVIGAPAPAGQQYQAFGNLDRIPVGAPPGSVAPGDGAGRLAPAPGSPVAAGNMPNDIALRRFASDSALDIAVANHETDYLTVLLSDGRDEVAVSNLNSGGISPFFWPADPRTAESVGGVISRADWPRPAGTLHCRSSSRC